MRLYAVPLLLLAGCGGKQREDPPAAGAAAGSGAGGVDSGGAGGVTSGGSGGGEMGGGSGGAEMGGSGGQATADDRLQPLEVGRRWSYTRTVLDPAGPAAGCLEPLESFVAGVATADGEQGWDYRPTCLPGYSVTMLIQGDDIRAFVNRGPVPVQYAMPPVQAGASWDADGVRYAWQEAGTVAVPAGSFERCWRRVLVEQPENYLVLCRGVGLVATHSAAENYRLELASKNF